jgi:hypothetical protein
LQVAAVDPFNRFKLIQTAERCEKFIQKLRLITQEIEMLQSFTNSIQHRCTAIMTLIYDYLAFTVTAKEKSTKFKKNGDHFSAGDPLKRIL